jgi:hypothetical protein
MIAILRTALPWLAGLAILAVLGARTDLHGTRAALASCDLPRFALAAAAFLLAALALDALVLARLFQAALERPISWTSMLLWRAASYAWLAVSFHAASASLLTQIRTATGESWTRLAAVLAVHYAADAAALATLALAGSVAAVRLNGAPAPLAIALVWATLAALLLLARHLPRMLRGNAPDHALRPLAAARIGELLLGRVVWYGVLVLFVMATLPTFDLRIPARDVLARMPIVLAVAALPIAPGGIGTTQAGMLALFADRAPAPVLLAYSLAYSAVLLLARVPLGALAWLAAGRLAHGGDVPS